MLMPGLFIQRLISFQRSKEMNLTISMLGPPCPGFALGLLPGFVGGAGLGAGFLAGLLPPRRPRLSRSRATGAGGGCC